MIHKGALFYSILLLLVFGLTGIAQAQSTGTTPPQLKQTEPKQSPTGAKEGNGKEKSSSDKPPQEKEKEGKEKEKKEDKPKSPHTFSATISFVSDYRFRGISQTMRRPAIQGNFDYSHKSGFYLGTFGSNVDGTTHYYNNTSMEWDFYGGYKRKPFPCRWPDFAYNVGLIYYYYPGGKAHNRENTRYNTLEYFIELTYRWLSVKFSQALTDYFGVNSHNPPFNWEKHRPDRPNGSSRWSTYVEANLTFELWDKFNFRCLLKGGKLSLLLHVAHLTVRHYEHDSYTDWRASLTQEFDWFSVFLTYVGTNTRHAYFDVPDNSFHPRKRHLGVQEVIVGLIKTF